VTARLVAAGVTPNAISLFSVACATFASGCLAGTAVVAAPAWRSALYVLAVVGIQGRLLCNLFDGMVAVEGGKAGKAGEVYNDFPDRVADPLVLVAAGYAAGGAWGAALGWAAAVLAVMTAYVRVLGRSLGAGVYFIGPMAKQHRMATLTIACLASAGAVWFRADRLVMGVALVIIAAGCVVTVVRRTGRVVADLGRRP